MYRSLQKTSIFATVFHSVGMSQLQFHVSLRILLLASVFVSQSGSSMFNITRYTKGDVFQNENSSESCNISGASCVSLKEDNLPFCGVNCCSCVCLNHSPTYLLSNGNCSSEDHLMSILKTQSEIQDCDHRMVVAESHFQCGKEVITTLETPRFPGKRSMYLCPWYIGDALIHFKHIKDLTKCEIVPEESLYLVNSSWQKRSPRDPFVEKLEVEIGQDPVFDNDKLYLKWNADIEKQYEGLIFSLKLRCRGKQGKDLKSCVHFKKGGSFTNFKPTFKPTLMRSTGTQTTSVWLSTKRTEKTKIETTEATPQTTSTSRKNTTSIAHVSTSLILKDIRGTSHDNALLVILASLAGALFGLLACSALVFLLWRRKRSLKKEANKAANPLYERGASGTIKLTHIPSGKEHTEEILPDYQPLVENTKPRERTDSLPGYRALSIGQRPNQQPTSDRGVRSSNYLNLIKDDPEEGRMYQTLLTKDSEKLEIINEANMPDYAELEERSDSEDSFDSDDSKDYAEPPAVETVVKRKTCLPEKHQLNNLSLAFADYDEPEGIIVISDNENDSSEQVLSGGNDFHDYADPDDTDEDNVNSHVTPQEDLSCYHDYDDPAE